MTNDSIFTSMFGSHFGWRKFRLRWNRGRTAARGGDCSFLMIPGTECFGLRSAASIGSHLAPVVKIETQSRTVHAGNEPSTMLGQPESLGERDGCTSGMLTGVDSCNLFGLDTTLSERGRTEVLSSHTKPTLMKFHTFNMVCTGFRRPSLSIGRGHLDIGNM